MALPTPKTPLQIFAAQEEIVETSRNEYTVNNQYDLSKVPMTNGVDIGTPADQAQRAKDIAFNTYNVNNQYDASSV